MEHTTHCPTCGLKLAANAPHGLCPGCLFRNALESQATRAFEAHTATEITDIPPTPQELAEDFSELEILRFVGRGGMGMVYQARQKQLDRVVAIKILSPKMARDPAFSERFAREARMMALLTHPNVVTVFEFGSTSPTGSDRQPRYYLLMEFVDGLTLRQLLDAGQLSPLQAFAIVPQICEALQYAHDRGIVHRDIKPENILLDRNGVVKIADFGLAKLLGLQAHDVTISTSGQILGTLYYMAPEQMERPLDVDHRADIYSLGVVFYQMLTGELPLGRFALPSTKAAIDARLDEVILRALEKEPNRRYQNASALRSQVETIATTANVPWVQGSQPTSFKMRPRKRSTTLRNVIAAVVISFAIVQFGLAYRGRTMTASQLADSPQYLASASTSKVIEAALDKPQPPWAFQELERRQLTPEEANQLIEGLSELLRREDHESTEHSLNSVAHSLIHKDHFFESLDKKGLISEHQKLEYLKALNGDLGFELLPRLREGMKEISLHIEWRWGYWRNLFGLSLMNEARSVTIDGVPVSFGKDFSQSQWESTHFLSQLKLPDLKPGAHRIQVEVVSALVDSTNLVGFPQLSRSEDWPPAKMRWVRFADMDLNVYSHNAVIVALTTEADEESTTRALSVNAITIRNRGQKTQAAFQIESGSSRVKAAMSFDVQLKIDGRFYPCASYSISKSKTRLSTSNTVQVTEVTGIPDEATMADVILTPNPKWIERQPEVTQIWGKEVVLQNVPLRRLDLETADSN